MTDTRQKRMAVAGVARPFMRAVDANSLDAAQRTSIGNAYPVGQFPAVSQGDGYGIKLVHPPHTRGVNPNVKGFGK